MTIKKKPATASLNQDALDKFVQAAPDAKEEKPAPDGEDNLKQISMTISKSDLARVDAAAKRQRISRAAFIRQSIIAAIPD